MGGSCQCALGGYWLSSQGVAAPRDVLLRCLELGFDGVAPAPGARPLRWDLCARELADLPLGVPILRVDCPVGELEGSLASARAEDREPVRERVFRAAGLGRLVGCPTLLLQAPSVPLSAPPVAGSRLDEPASRVDREGWAVLSARLRAERSRWLDTACRNLHALAGELPEHRLCLCEATDLCSASQVEDLEVFMSELASLGLGYWHRPAIVAARAELSGEEPGDALERLSKYLVGSDLADHDSEGIGALPGSGGVDYGSLAPYMRALGFSLPTVCELDPRVPDADLRQARAFLGKFGL